MKRLYFHCTAITLVFGTACGSNEIGNGSHSDASQGGSGAVAGANHTSSGNTGGRATAVGGSRTGLGSAAGIGSAGATPVVGGSGNVGGSSGDMRTAGGSSELAGVGGVTATGGSTGGSTSDPMTTGGSVAAATGGSVVVATGGSVVVATGGSAVVATGGSVVAATGGSVVVATGGSVAVATGGSAVTTTGGTIGIASSTTGNATGGKTGATGGTSGIGGSTICVAGELAPCSTGLPGVCASGQKKCNATGTAWNACVQLQAKGLADCSSTLDNDCDGQPDSTEMLEYRVDADQDKYCTVGTIYACKGSQPSSAVLASTCLGTDCSDSNYFRNVSCVTCVTGLTVTEDDEAGPAGFEKINVDLNKGVGGNYIWLWKRVSDDAPCLTDIELSYTSDPSANPFDSTWTVSPVNLNDGVAADKIIHIGWKVAANGTSIQDVSVISVNSKVSDSIYSTSSTSTWYISQWTAGSKDGDGNELTGNADANKNVSGPYIYVIYKK